MCFDFRTRRLLRLRTCVVVCVTASSLILFSAATSARTAAASPSLPAIKFVNGDASTKVVSNTSVDTVVRGFKTPSFARKNAALLAQTYNSSNSQSERNGSVRSYRGLGKLIKFAFIAVVGIGIWFVKWCLAD